MGTRAEPLQTPSAATKETQELSNPKMPHSLTTASPPQPSNLNSNPGSGSGAAAPSGWVAMPKTAVHVNTQRKKLSIERFLGNSHEQFVRGGNSTISNGSSPQGPGSDNGLPSAGKSTKTTSSRSTAVDPLAISGGSEEQRYEYLGPAATTTSLAVIKSVPMPRFPIRVFNGEPPPFSLELQRRKMRWRYDWFQNLEPHCIHNPEIHRIQETARSYVKSIAPETDTVSVNLLAVGGFNQAYNVTTENLATGFHKKFIFRISLPIWPYYKVESDVATTEFVRHATGIPVPIIYAFDSNPRNQLGFEWMLMEKVQGTPLTDAWDTMDFDSKQGLTRTIASWMAELSQLNYSKIGSIFMRYQECQMEFYIGPAIHERLFVGDLLLHEIDRGPFQSVQALYDAILDIKEKYVNDPRHGACHALRDSMSKKIDKHQEPSGPDMTCDTQQPTADSEEVILARADSEDQENQMDCGIPKGILSWPPENLSNYRIMLPTLCAMLPTSGPLTTMLTHPDMSQANILVKKLGVPVALIDWEMARLPLSTSYHYSCTEMMKGMLSTRHLGPT